MTRLTKIYLPLIVLTVLAGLFLIEKIGSVQRESSLKENELYQQIFVLGTRLNQIE